MPILSFMGTHFEHGRQRTPVLSSAGALLVLGSVDVARWAARARLVTAIAAAGELGAPAGYRVLAEHTGLSERYVWRVLGQLADERVIVGLEGAGRRPPTWWVRAEVRGWLGVPWAVSVEQVELRLFHGEQPRGAIAGVAPRSYVAALADVAPRSYVAAQPDVVPRSRGAAQGVDPRRALHRGANGPAALGSSALGGSGAASGDDPSSLLGRIEGGRESIDTVRRAMLAKTGDAFVNGGPLGLVMRALADHGLAAVLEAVERAPGDLRVPRLAQWVDLWAGQGGGPAAGEDPPAAAPAAPAEFYRAEVFQEDPEEPDPVAALARARLAREVIG